MKSGVGALAPEFFDNYHIVNLSGGILYVEGHVGLVTLSDNLISFKVKGGIIVVEGKELTLKELSERTMKISGKVKRVEFF